MANDGELVVPGEEVATAEEFLAGPGTYERGGKIISNSTGILSLDTGEMVARVSPSKPILELETGDIVIGRVTDLRPVMAMVEIISVEGSNRRLSGGTLGTIHISKVSEGFTKDISGELRLMDIVRARVAQSSPSIQLFTAARDLGVLRALCQRCRSPLERTGEALVCSACENRERRNISSHYGAYCGFLPGEPRPEGARA